MGKHAGKPKPGNPGYGGHGTRGIAKGGKHAGGCLAFLLMLPIAGATVGAVIGTVLGR